jgi:hypothetical protein
VDLESLGVARLDISTSASMPTAGSLALTALSNDDVVQAAWRLIEAADTRCIGQVESPGFQALLRRVRETSREGPSARPAVASVEELAQLLALWRPGAAGLANEASYLAARFGDSARRTSIQRSLRSWIQRTGHRVEVCPRIPAHRRRAAEAAMNTVTLADVALLLANSPFGSKRVLPQRGQVGVSRGLPSGKSDSGSPPAPTLVERGGL